MALTLFLGFAQRFLFFLSDFLRSNKAPQEPSEAPIRAIRAIRGRSLFRVRKR